MTKYEYILEDYQAPIAQFRLNDYGEAGWELITILARTSFGENRYYHFFKRAIPEDMPERQP